MRNMLKVIVAVIFLLLSIFIYVLWKWVPQGHGSVSNYSFNFSKIELEHKIDSVIKLYPNLSRKPLEPHPNDNYYNKNEYFTIIIEEIQYCFRYYGDSTEWADSNNNSEIFIASITDTNHEKSHKKDEEYLKIIENKFIKKLGEYLKK